DRHPADPAADGLERHALAATRVVDEAVVALLPALAVLLRVAPLSGPARAGRGLDAEELLGDLLDVVRRRRDVARPDLPLEVDLDDRVAGGVDREREQAQHRRGRVVVRRRVLAAPV